MCLFGIAMLLLLQKTLFCNVLRDSKKYVTNLVISCNVLSDFNATFLCSVLLHYYYNLCIEKYLRQNIKAQID